ncbi:alpha/beta hydrolase [Roseomonas sp. CAU 1739]|uniref:alpha/beta hydrolase n=1 Tax=Roseomonas sp. CAU 1739 TaxID=3140364 RepID=UPI00325BC25E
MNAWPVWEPAPAGRSPFYAAPGYSCFSYCLYVPRQRPEGKAPLIVAMHGSDRRPEVIRTLHAPLCDRTGAVVLTPLFPIGAVAPDDEPGYKVCAFRGMRYDLALLAMVADAATRLPLDIERFMMTGFSGGAQFVQRFLLLHPTRLDTVSIGAPGYVTLLDENLPWWAGTGDFAATFGHPPDIAAMRDVTIQLVIGTRDTGLDHIAVPRGDPRLMEAVERSGATRIGRMLTLEANLRAAGCDARLDWVEGATHAVRETFAAVEAFLAARLGAISPAGRVPS